MKINFDFRLLDVSLELHALEEHFELIEKQLAHLIVTEKDALDEYRKKEDLTPDDPEWDIARQEFDHRVEFLGSSHKFVHDPGFRQSSHAVV